MSCVFLGEGPFNSGAERVSGALGCRSSAGVMVAKRKRERRYGKDMRVPVEKGSGTLYRH